MKLSSPCFISAPRFAGAMPSIAAPIRPSSTFWASGGDPRRTASSAAGSGTESVITLSTLDAVEKFTQLNSKGCCLYYTAVWCGPCRTIQPIYAELSKTYHGSIALGKIDVDDNPEAAAAAQIRSVPTFVFYQNNQCSSSFSGADANQLRTKLSELAAAAAVNGK